jgi:hypothetical protein
MEFQLDRTGSKIVVENILAVYFIIDSRINTEYYLAIIVGAQFIASKMDTIK